MNLQQMSSAKRGFTLAELVVAMAITAIIVTVLITVTSVALDTWNRSRSELRAARNAKTMVDFMARDFESLVIRKGNSYEWLSAVTDPDVANIGGNIKSTNASKLIFFTSAKDRYDGKIGVAEDYGGEVSCVAYQLKYRDSMEIDSDKVTGFETFVFNRLVVDPDDAFRDMLGKTDLSSALSATPTRPRIPEEVNPNNVKKKKYSTPLGTPKIPDQLLDPTNFLCENIYQFTVTFQVSVIVPASGTNPATTVNVPVTIGPDSPDRGPMTATSFKVNGAGIVSDITGGTVSNAQLAAGKITGVSFSTTVISDFGIQQMKQRTFATSAQKADFIAKNSYQFTKLVPLSPP